MKKTISLWLTLLLLVLGAGPVYGVSQQDQAETIKGQIEKTLAYLTEQTPEPQISSVGGEWILIGGLRSSVGLPEVYVQRYENHVEETLGSCGGVLSDRKYTEYARAALAACAMGKSPSDIGGYDLIQPLRDYDKTIYQGVNGASYALLALDAAAAWSGGEEAVCSRYVAYLLDRQLDDGGFALSGDTGDPDVTAMVLQALSGYTEEENVKRAVEQGLSYLSQTQNDLGGYTAWGETNSESTAQVIVALCQLGIDPEDSRFVKNGHTLLENLMLYRTEEGGFRHLDTDTKADQMATEQALCALTAYERFLDGKSGIFDMEPLEQDMTNQESDVDPGQGETFGGSLSPEGLTRSVKTALTAVVVWML